jgi:hypothetical protein
VIHLRGWPSLFATTIPPLCFGLDFGDPDLGSFVVIEHKFAEDDVDFRALTTRDFFDVAHDWAVPGALFRTGPVESVEFERGDRCEADGEFSQRSAISGGQDLPVLEVGDAAFDGGADTGEVLVCVDLGW